MKSGYDHGLFKTDEYNINFASYNFIRLRYHSFFKGDF